MATKLKNYSTTPASNNSTPPDGWPEGMAPSAVNNSAREMMARLREWYEDAEWINIGHTIVSASGADIVLSGDVTAAYPVGRAVRADGDSGFVTAAVFGGVNTTVTTTGIAAFAGSPALWEIGVLSSTVTAFALTLLDDASASAARTTLSLGTAATQNTGTSGANVPLLNGANTWSATQTFSVAQVVAAGSAAAPSIAPTGDANTGLLFPAADTAAIATAGAERMRIDSAGRALIGHSTNRAAVASLVQVEAANATASLSAVRNSNDANPSFLNLGKSRATSVGGVTIVQSGDTLGTVLFFGTDGSDLVQAASVSAAVDGTPGANDMPGRLVFSTTPDGSASPSERMRVDNLGNVVVNTAAIATTATDGFPYIPTCAGTPTGVPTTYTGRAPLVIDSTNNRLYFYSGGAWRNAGP